MSGKIKLTDEQIAQLVLLEKDGRLTPSSVVEDARNPDSPLHSLFQWDVDKAAYAHWLAQARLVIKSSPLVIVDEAPITLKAPHYVRDPNASGKEQGYVSVLTLRADPPQARASLMLEFSRVESALNRARSLAVALEMEDEIDSLIAQLVRVKQLAAA